MIAQSEKLQYALSAFYSLENKVLCSSSDFKSLNYFFQEQCIKLLAPNPDSLKTRP